MSHAMQMKSSAIIIFYIEIIGLPIHQQITCLCEYWNLFCSALKSFQIWKWIIYMWDTWWLFLVVVHLNGVEQWSCFYELSGKDNNNLDGLWV